LLDLEQKIAAFMDIPTDIEIKENQVLRTQIKKETAVSLCESIEDIMMIVGRKYPKKTAHYRSFGTKNLTNQSDADLYFTAHLVVVLGAKYLAELAPYGLNPTLLNALDTLKNEYLERLIDQQVGSFDREIFREERVTKANEIYATLSSYMTVGQSIWRTKSAAKTNDYMLYSKKEITNKFICLLLLIGLFFFNKQK